MRKFTLGILSEAEVDIDDMHTQADCNSFLHEVLRHYAVEKALEERRNPDYPEILSRFYFGSETAGYGFHYVENQSEHSLFHTISYVECTGMEKLFNSDRRNNEYLCKLEPNSYKLLLYKRNALHAVIQY